MKRTTRIIIVGIVVPGLGSYAAAQQDVFTFTKDDGAWGVALNWQGPPGQFPEVGDKAIIPVNTICRVQAANRAAEIVQVDTGGTLVIETTRTLTIDTDGDGTNDAPKLTVNGEVHFEGTNATLVYGNTGLVAPANHFDLDGTGRVLADRAAGPNNGIIRNKSGSEHVLEIKSPLTLKGSLEILWDTPNSPGAEFDATFLVDNAADTMEIGASGLRKVRGSGTFDVSAGLMTFRVGFVPKIKKDKFDGSFKVSGSGTMTFERLDSGPNNLVAIPNYGSFEVSGGTLRIERGWESYGGIEFSSGKIEVSPMISAGFIEAP